MTGFEFNCTFNALIQELILCFDFFSTRKYASLIHHARKQETQLQHENNHQQWLAEQKIKDEQRAQKLAEEERLDKEREERWNVIVASFKKY